MYLTNIPLVLSSLTFWIPCSLALELQNQPAAIAWGALAISSTLVHCTKKPYHLYGENNCIWWLYLLDVVALYGVALQSFVDGWHGGGVGLFTTTVVVGYASVVFYVGKPFKLFVYDPAVSVQILSHISSHLLSSFGGSAVLLLREYRRSSFTS